MRKNPKTIKIAILASIKSNTCNCGFSRKGIFSHDLCLCGEEGLGHCTAEALRARSKELLLKKYS
jgi:hypothetical protein